MAGVQFYGQLVFGQHQAGYLAAKQEGGVLRAVQKFDAMRIAMGIAAVQEKAVELHGYDMQGRGVV